MCDSTEDYLVGKYTSLVASGLIPLSQAQLEIGASLSGTRDRDDASFASQNTLIRVHHATRTVDVDLVRLVLDAREKWGSPSAADEEIGSRLRNAEYLTLAAEVRHRVEKEAAERRERETVVRSDRPRKPRFRLWPRPELNR